MAKTIWLLLALTVTVSVVAAPLFKTGNQLEIRKYRFSRHSGKGFERLVLEFDHLGTDGSKPELKVESLTNEAKITIDSAHLSGVIPESEINRSFLTSSQVLGAIAISAEKNSFRLLTNLKRKASVEAFWLDKPARLVVDVFPMDRTALNPQPVTRKVASHTPEPKLEAPMPAPAMGDVYCFPANTQLQASVGFGKKDGDNSNSLDEKGGLNDSNIVCFPADSRLTPQITYKLAPYPISTGSIQTDLVGGSQKLYSAPSAMPAPTVNLPVSVAPTFNEPPMMVPNATVAVPQSHQWAPSQQDLAPQPDRAPTPVAAPATATAPASISALPTHPAEIAPSVTTTAAIPETRTPTSVGPEIPDAKPATPSSPPEPAVMPTKDLPTTSAEVAAPPAVPTADAGTVVEEASKDSGNPFPAPRRKKKKSRARLPQLPSSITEGALLPPVK
ncbi:MAG: hypothetical protein HYR96_13830 [Deltaproteobacteria bacterium]|nr:hypothetical protein [Deltaproteobacteria bacterium]MBI3296113.1 hypothetical protein [Deltaproteobacteria bacterium]